MKREVRDYTLLAAGLLGWAIGLVLALFYW